MGRTKAEFFRDEAALEPFQSGVVDG